MKAVILAGGMGTRMGNESANTPKPMTLICGKPVLQHQIEALKKEGIEEFIFTVGYLSNQIEEYFGNGSAFGVRISYFHETEPLGTGGALFRLGIKDDFLVCNGDLIFDFCLDRMVDFHHKNKALATLFSHPNDHPYDSVLICTKEDGCITNYISEKKKKSLYSNLCNAGIYILSPDLLRLYSPIGKTDLDHDIIRPAVNTCRIFAYKSAEYVHDMGTPQRVLRVERDINAGIVRAKNCSLLQKAIFLDRDGTVNKYKGYITNPDDIELIPGAAEAISFFNRSGFLVIIVTNQPVIARGECSYETLNEIHKKLEVLLGEKGAYVDAIYYCPHHPDKGFENEREELKIRCECRKPSPGLILKAKKDFNINISESFMVGDTMRDIQTAQNAGCIPILMNDKAASFELKNISVFKSLYDFSKDLKKRTDFKTEVST
ncbi:MAG: HAD-IIIA family hydrolase [Acutalibacteraceae bacterium]